MDWAVKEKLSPYFSLHLWVSLSLYLSFFFLFLPLLLLLLLLLLCNHMCGVRNGIPHQQLKSVSAPLYSGSI